MHWRKSYRFLPRTPLKIRVKPQKQPLQLFYKKGVVRNFLNFIEKHLYRKLFSIELQAKRPKHKCFPVKFMKFLETGGYEQLLLKPVVSPGVSSHQLKLVHGFQCVKSVQVWSLSWSVFSHNWTEYQEIRSIQCECGKIRTRKNPVIGNFSRSVLYYNLQFRLPILTSLPIPWNYNANTIDSAKIRSSRLVVFCKTGVVTIFTKFTRKQLYQGLLLKEAADLQSLTSSKKEIPTHACL